MKNFEEQDDEIELTEEEKEILQQEIERREQVLGNLVQAAVDGNPAEVAKHFEGELKYRLAEMLEGYKTDLLQGLVEPELEESEELDEDTQNLFQAVSELTEDEFKELMEDPDLSDEDKETLIQIVEAIYSDDEETAD